MKQWLYLAVILSALLLPACVSTSLFFGKIAVPQKPILRFNNGEEPRTLDPHKSNGEQENNLIINILEGLTVYHPKTLEPLPGVAERWEAQEEAKRWIFYLRKDIRWTDNKPVTAHDFVYAWQRAIDPATASPNQTLFLCIKNAEAIANKKMDKSQLGVETIDDYTLKVEMESPTGFFPSITSLAVFSPLPRWTIEKEGQDWTRVDKIVSNGAFLLKEHKPYNRIVLEKNPNYWDAANVRLDRVVVLPVKEQETNVNLYKAGEIDVMVQGWIPQAFIKTLKQKKDFVAGASFTTTYYAFNATRKPLSDLRVRRALALAFDKEFVNRTFLAERGSIAAYTLVPPLAGYQPFDGPHYNPEEAKRLLAEAGYPNGAGFPVLNLYFSTNSNIKQLSEIMQSMWQQQLNIKVELHNEEFATFQARQEARNYDICRTAWVGDYLDPDAFLKLFVEDNLTNITGWISKPYKDALTAANKETDAQKRMLLLAEAEKILMAEMPIMPVYYHASNYLIKPYVKGWEANVLDKHPFKFVYIDNNWQN